MAGASLVGNVSSSPSTQARRLLGAREQRLRELEAQLKSQVAQATNPELRRALARVEEALAVANPEVALTQEQHPALKPTLSASPAAVTRAVPQVPGLDLADACGDAPGGVATPRPSSRAPLEGRPGCSSPSPQSAAASPRLGSPRGLTPRPSQSSSSQAPPSQPSRTSRPAPLAVAAGSLRSPGTVALCKDLDEMLAAVPARAAEPLRRGFAKLLTELHALEQRLLTQARAGEDLRAAFARLPEPSLIEQRLQKAEKIYRWHIERLSTRDRTRARGVVQARGRVELYSDRTAELLDEVERMRKRLLQAKAKRKEAEAAPPPPSAQSSQALSDLKAQLEAKTLELRLLERDLAGSRKVFDEHLALSRRLRQLTGESFEEPKAPDGEPGMT